MKKKESITKNYFYNLCYQILVIIIPIITTPYISRTLGAKEIGIYSYVYSIVSTFILFGTLGITLYAQREIAYTQNNIKERSKVFFELCIIRFITIGISIVVYYFTCIKNQDYSLYYIILLAEIVANCIDISWLLQGMEQFKKTVVRNIIVKVLSTIAIFIFVKKSSDLYLYTIIRAASVFLGNLSLLVYIPKYVICVKLNELEIKKHIKPILLLFIPQIALQIYMVLDKTMIGNVLSEKSEVGYYEQAQKIIRLLLSVITSLGTVMVPRMASVYVNKDEEKIKYYMNKSFDFVLALAVPMTLGLIAISKYFVPVFYGEGYEKVITLLIVGSPLIIVIGLNNITGVQFLLPTKKQKEFTIAVLLGSITNFLLNFIFIKKWESAGATFTSVIAELIILLVEIFYCKKYVSIKEIGKISLKKVIAGIGMFLVIIFIPYYINNIVTLFIKCCVGAALYFLILWVEKDSFFKYATEKMSSIIRSKIKKKI